MTISRTALILLVGVAVIYTGCARAVPPATPPDPTAIVSPGTTPVAPSPEPQQTQGPNEIWMRGFEFNPNGLTVPVGTKVVWTNTSRELHTVTSYDGLFDANIVPGNSFSYTFNVTGIFHYYCGLHPGMAGTITVQ